MLIPKNSPLPASATLYCRPSRDGIRNHGVLITEGDEEDLGACSVVGRCVLADLPPGVTTQARFTITLRLDESNLLEAVVRHHDTGKEAQALVELTGAERGPYTADGHPFAQPAKPE